ncbi:unnamed protein product [Linum trigynum]|uniref:Uncharacterized protein n=1 Tax=Linum trigynum TaxID=586398 RepID=A0AAV2E8W5_9ROSI
MFGLNGNLVNLKDHLSDLSLNVITRMVLGKKYIGVTVAGDCDARGVQGDARQSLLAQRGSGYRGLAGRVGPAGGLKAF